MTAPNEVVGEAVVKVRACGFGSCSNAGAFSCLNCRGDDKYLSAAEATEVQRVDVYLELDPRPLSHGDRIAVETDPEGDFWRPVEKGDSDGD